MNTHTHLKSVIICLAAVLFVSALASAGTWTALDKPGGTETMAWGIDSGNIVGSYHQGNADHGFRYDGSNWTTIDVDGARNTYAQGISGNNIVGYCIDSSYNYRGFLYNGSGYSTFSAPGAEMTFAYAVDGTNIVGRCHYTDTGNYSGFLYNGSSWTILNAPGAKQTMAMGISGNKIYGYYQDSSDNIHSFILEGTNWTTIDMPQNITDSNGNPLGGRTFIYGADGINFVGYRDNPYTYMEEGFFYNGSDWTILNMPGAERTWANDISGNTIIGTYMDAGYHSFIYAMTDDTSVPEPATLLLLGLGAIITLRKR